MKQDKFAVTELFKEISVKVADRPGGYTRIIKTGHRLGDNAEMCFIAIRKLEKRDKSCLEDRIIPIMIFVKNR